MKEQNQITWKGVLYGDNAQVFTKRQFLFYNAFFKKTPCFVQFVDLQIPSLHSRTLQR